MLHKLETLLEQWRSVPPILLPVAAIETTEALQPRALDAVPVKYRPRLDDQSEQHIARMRAKLEQSPATDMDALLIARSSGRMLVVDGHHRLEAYRLAQRVGVPARVLPMKLLEAVAAARLVNCDGTKLPLHPDQAREAAWQYIGEATLYGRRALPSAESLRSIAAAFGVPKSTVDRMKKAAGGIDLGQFTREALDTATGWPRWRYCRGSAWRDSAAEVPLGQRQRAQAERLAAKVSELFEKAGPAVVRLAAAIVREQRQDGAADLLDSWHEEEQGVVSDY
jgi:ParB-like chromosome segregation protein Spo0J